MTDQVKKIVGTFFQKLEITIDNLDVTEEEKNIFRVKIETPESWLIIWPHGKSLWSIETLLKLLISKVTDSKTKIHIEVNDYQSSKDERLKSFIQSKVEYVNKTGKDLKLPYYSPYERKKIHGFVGEFWNNKIYTKSIGEQNQRRLYICKKAEALTIDIDGDDI